MAKKKRPKFLAPYQAKDTYAVCLLNRDNIGNARGWILTDGYRVSLVNQKAGHSPTGSVDFSLKEFERFARWYLRAQKVRQARR